MAQGFIGYWEQNLLETELNENRRIMQLAQQCPDQCLQIGTSLQSTGFLVSIKASFWPVMQAAEDLEEILGSKTEEAALPASNGNKASTNGASAVHKADTGPASNGSEGVSKTKDDMLKETGGIGSTK